MQRSFHQIDVFATDGFTGNPVAVVHDAEGISTEAMLRFTDWTNLSETTFLVPTTDEAADYRVRIFCPGRELPFAGHPTLGTCQAWLAAGGVPKGEHIVQECGAGLVPIRRDGDRLAFAAPPVTRTGPIDPDLLAERLEQLGLEASEVVDSAWIDNGPGWMGLLLESAEAVLAVDMPTGRIPNFDVGLVGPSAPGAETAFELRAFFPDSSNSIREDPVTGSLNASVAQWLTSTGRATLPYVAAQGTAIGRQGRIYVDGGGVDGDGADGADGEAGEIWVGGHCSVSISGSIDI